MRFVEEQDLHVPFRRRRVDQVVAARSTSASPSPVTTHTDQIPGRDAARPVRDRRPRAAVDRNASPYVFM